MESQESLKVEERDKEEVKVMPSEKDSTAIADFEDGGRECWAKEFSQPLETGND